DDLITAIAASGKICHYIDLPIQHCVPSILKKMGRRGDATLIRDIVSKLRSRIPDLILRTSVIAGFPGESGQDFKELCDFIEEIRFDRLGCFEYSKEEGTPAATFKGQIPTAVKKSRREKIMQIQKRISYEKNQQRLGNIYRTFVEGITEDELFYFGRTYGESPDIDGKVYFTSPDVPEKGSFADVEIVCADDYDLTGIARSGNHNSNQNNEK
ncbi:MAG: 30S ribosomal protein S12 methylthiotransferase RimO, partial [Clostridiales bacterium]|nr:30S ribosomal protein S12 methylthiotransferase RimO [Clostridiales bacterium]